MSRTSITPQSCVSPLKGRRVAFTGKLVSMSRLEARHVVHQAGGRAVATINRHTDMLVVGMDGWPLLADGRMSRKLQQAEQFRERGGRIRLCSEAQFLELVGRAERRSGLRKCYGVLQVTALLGIEEATLRRWEALGLVRSHDDQFDFQDLVSLRSIVSLIKAGVSPQTISRSMRQLASVLPGTDRPLAQLKIVAEDSGTLLAEIDGSLVTVAGQFLMPFESRNVETSKRPNVRAPIGGVSATATSAGMPVPALDVWTFGRLDVSLMERSADEWFDIASDHEEAGQPAEAIAAYRHALAARPAFPQANFNLANVLRAAGRLEGAEERFRIAIEQNPQMAEAWFNLADLLDQQGRLHEAIACLRTAARCAPHYADAHYNLAACCESAGLLDEAREHWREYLKFDHSSEWASIARRKVSS